MNPFILLFADGTMFFVGMLLTVAAVCSARWLAEQGWRSVSAIGSCIGILLVVVSATPLPLSVYGAWLALCVSALILSVRNTVDASNQTVAGVHRTLLVLMAGLSILLCLWEWPHRGKPEISVLPGTMIYIVGDSISAGMGTKERNWPEVLADSTKLRIVNLARPGATVKTAFAQVEKIPRRRCLIIVEIGGNDLLGGTGSDAFAESLDALLAKLHSHEHRIVMFELPLPPLYNAFGRAQREAARRHHATLIPKHCMTTVLGTRNGTLDGLHLSQTGHDALAEEIERMLRLAD